MAYQGNLRRRKVIDKRCSDSHVALKNLEEVAQDAQAIPSEQNMGPCCKRLHMSEEVRDINSGRSSDFATLLVVMEAVDDLLLSWALSVRFVGKLFD